MSNYNCIVCSKEFDPLAECDEVSTEINQTQFKVCMNCISLSDPVEGYAEVKKIISWYKNESIFKKIKKDKNALQDMFSADEYSEE